MKFITLIELINNYPSLTYSFKNNPMESLQHIENIKKLDSFSQLNYIIIGNENKLQKIKHGKFIYPDALIVTNNKIIERIQLKYSKNKIFSQSELNKLSQYYINNGFCNKIKISFKKEELLKKQLNNIQFLDLKEKFIFSKINPNDLNNLNQIIYLEKELLQQNKHKNIINLFKKEILQDEIK